MARFTQNAGGTGSALNYVQVAGQQVTVADAPASIIDLFITTTGKPVQISVTGEGSNASAGSWIRVNLFRDGVAIGNEIQIEASAQSENVPYAINFIDDVTAGTYSYSVRATDKSSGNWTFGEVAGPVMNAVELTGFQGNPGPQGPAGADGADADGGPKIWTSSNDVQYGIYQAHGGIEITTDTTSGSSTGAVALGNQTNSFSFPLIIVDPAINEILTEIVSGSLHSREILLIVNGLERKVTVGYTVGQNGAGWVWYFNSLYPVTLLDSNTYDLNLVYGSAPTIWWDAATLPFDIADNDFRGAKIDYHAYASDAGTMVGTIYIASDSGDTHVTHIETGSGGNDLGAVELWHRKSGGQVEERRLYLYRTDGESQLHKIQWTAQVYYASEFWD